MAGWRLLDTGVRSAAENLALDQALLLARARGRSPNTVRFLQFSPPAVLVGRFQVVEQEVREAYCRANGIELNRRLTGGGAILFDEPQLGWELVAASADFDVQPFGPAFAARFGEVLVRALARFKLSAAFRPRNDVEINGRKICGTGGAEEGGAFLWQGTLLTDFNLAAMLRALRVPVEKLRQAELASAAERVTWLKRELGETPPLEELKAALAAGFAGVFGVDLVPGGLLPAEEALFREILPQFTGAPWLLGRRLAPSRVATFHDYRRTPGGVVRADVQLDLARKRLRAVLLTGDLLVNPSRALYDLEAALKDVRPDPELVRARADEVWTRLAAEGAGLGPADLAAAINGAAAKAELVARGLTPEEADGLFAVGGAPREILEREVGLLLLPYCAKVPDCAFRQRPDCDLCGGCTVGAGFELARSLDLPTVAVTSFEHLLRELAAARAAGVAAFVGCCCEAFYRRHQDEFERAGVPGLLLMIQDRTCYDLGRQREAYHGQFTGQTRLDLPRLTRLLELVRVARPTRPARPVAEKRL